MNDTNGHVMVALLPEPSGYFHDIEFPHLTLVYAGKISDHKSTGLNDLSKEALEFARRYSYQTLSVEGLDVFGPDDDRVDVLTVKASTDLRAMRTALEPWNMSEFKEYRPHITLGQEGVFEGQVPTYVAFDRIAVCWGNRKIIAYLGSHTKGETVPERSY